MKTIRRSKEGRKWKKIKWLVEGAFQAYWPPSGHVASADRV
jgi:hypothetical protein